MPILDQVIAYLGNLVGQLLAYITNQITTVANWLTGLVTTISNYVGKLFDSVGLFLQRVVEVLASWIQDAVETIVGFVRTAFERLSEVTAGIIDTIQGWITNAGAAIETFITDALEFLSEFISGVIETLRGLAEAALGAISEVATTIKDTVLGWAETVIGLAQQALDVLIKTAQGAINTLLGAADSLISTVASRIEDLASAFGEASAVIVKTLTDLGDETLKPIRDAFKNMSDFFKDTRNPAETQSALMSLDRIVKGPLTPELIQEFFGEGWIKFVPDKGIGAQIFFGIIGIAAVAVFFANAAGIQAQRFNQELALQYPWAVMSPADAAQAWRRTAIDRDAALDAIRRQGFSAGDANTMIDNTAQVPNEGELLALWNRGELEDEPLTDALFQRGFNSAWQARLKQLAKVIPPVQDLIVMAVREVFSPDIVSKFGQGEDFPVELKTWTEKQGLSEDWARKYWAAHWGLPSVSMGYEMLHRGVIRPEELELLLRAQDVMPFWRQKLIDISYSPYTRVDIRRMHQLGVLKEADVLKAHKDLGYDDEKAARLTDFVILLNKGGPSDDPEDLGKLSRTSILGFYSDGVIARDRARALLIQFGHTPEAADLYLLSEDADRQRIERKVEVGLIIEQAEAGIVTFDEAADKLRALKLETLEIERALTQLLRAQQKRNKLPSQSDGESFFIAGIIQQNEYDELLGRLGYASKWRNAFITKARKKASGGTRA